MITFMESKERSKEGEKKCLDSELWQACAGSMVQLPAVNSKVLYFPQGHLEHVSGSNLDFRSCPRMPAHVPCRVFAVKLMADPETDEVFAKMRLVPEIEVDCSKDSSVVEAVHEEKEKPSSFAKTLTQSDANNGGGFSVPRYCAETIFPRLDYSADPPVQTILVKDVHGTVWKFRHIYRGTPRRHLLTTGWSTFVNQKKLVAGDSVVFLRAENGDLCVGVRRATAKSEPVLSHPGYGGFWSKMMISNSNSSSTSSSISRGRGGGKGEDVIECVSLAAKGEAFDVVYYPRGSNSNSEFCVKAGVVKAALRIRWCSGMRFKMALETEDSSRISWFMGTISSVHLPDSLGWPWRLLQVRWDEPDLLQNVKSVNPWSVELVSNFHIPPQPQPNKRLRLEFPGMQGARHGITLSQLHHFSNATSIANHANISCLLNLGTPTKSESAPSLVLFGKQILTEKQISNTSSTGHCKVFMESDEVGRTIDLSLLASYAELLQKLAAMFHLRVDEVSNHVVYRDAEGALRQLGEEPFSKFKKSATRLRVVAKSSSGQTY